MCMLWLSDNQRLRGPVGWWLSDINQATASSSHCTVSHRAAVRYCGSIGLVASLQSASVCRTLGLSLTHCVCEGFSTL